MMVVVLLLAQEFGVDVEFGAQVEAAQVEHLADRHLTKVHHLLRRARVHVRQPVLQGVELSGVHQVGLADENLVGKAHLALRFDAGVELLGGVLGVDQGDDGVQQVLVGHLVVHEKGLRHRAGVGQAGGFDHHALEVQLALALSGRQLGQRGAQVVADGAADAAVAHLDDAFAGFGDEDFVVDVFLAEFVFDDGDLLPVRLGQHALQQRGFAGAKKAGQDGGGNLGHEGVLR